MNNNQNEKRVPDRIVARGVFSELVRIMEYDNGCLFTVLPQDFECALGAIVAMMHLGYFLCDADDMDADYWQMAAGEEIEKREHFARAPVAFALLDEILNDIFNRPLKETHSLADRIRSELPLIRARTGNALFDAGAHDACEKIEALLRGG